MCSVCRMTPCHDNCPNAEEPPAVCTCSDCRQSISVGDEYVNIDGVCYHLDCLEEMDTKKLLELCGYFVKEAEKITPEWDE